LPAVERPYVTERPDDLRRRWETCPVMGERRAKAPDWSLQRWKLVRDLVVGWYGDDRPDQHSVPDLLDSRVGFLDPVQRSVVERLFAGWRAIYPKSPDVTVDLEPLPVSVFDHERRVELRVSPTFGFSDGERVRLRLGSSASGPDDAALLAVAGEEGAVYIDAIVGGGVAEEIAAPPEPATRVAELVELAGQPPEGRINPGRWCFGCPSAARCGQYPVLGEGRVFVSTRSLTISKTQLGHLGTCHRRVAWSRVHQVPTDWEEEPRVGLVAGRRFHEMAALAITADDPDAVLAAECRGVAPAEAAELRRLWDNHGALWDWDGCPEVRRVEYPAGLTMLVPGVHVDSRGRESVQPVAVTFVGILDVTGREVDGTPMVVEHRTGTTAEHGHLEAELYAVSAAAAVWARTRAWPERVAVHLHHLRPDPPVCERTVFEDLEAAAAALRAAAETIAAWHPDESLSPAFSVGSWCQSCDHRPMCERFR
jgi:hypothetical protein